MPGHETLPFSLKVLLENLLAHRGRGKRHQEPDRVARLVGSDGRARHRDRVHPCTRRHAGLHGRAGASSTSPPCARRGALAATRRKMQPAGAAELVIDDSVIADLFGTENALSATSRSSTSATASVTTVPALGPDPRSTTSRSGAPGTGNVHQVNIEYLARVRARATVEGCCVRTPDTCVGTDYAHHHGQRPRRARLGRRWHRGRGRNAGQPSVDAHPEGRRSKPPVRSRPASPKPTSCSRSPSTAQARCRGQVGRVRRRRRRPGAARRPRDHRQHEPRVRLTAAMFPIDDVTLDYLRLTGCTDSRSPSSRRTRSCRAVARPVGQSPCSSEYLELDLRAVVPSIAGPKRPQDRVELVWPGTQFAATSPTTHAAVSRVDAAIEGMLPVSDPTASPPQDETPRTRCRTPREPRRPETCSRPVPKYALKDGASTRSTTALSPSRRSRRARTRPTRGVMSAAAGLLARDVNKKGLKAKPWVKTTLAPGQGRHRVLREGRPHRRP